MKYQNKRNGKVASLISEDSKFKTVLLEYEDGSTVSVSQSTLKRWWKQLSAEATNPEDIPNDQYVAEVMEQKKELGIECPPITEVEIVSEEKAGDGTLLTEVDKEIAKQAKEKAKAAKVKKASKEHKSAVDVTPIRDYVLDKVKELGGTVFVPANGMNLWSFKVDNKGFARFAFSKNRVTIHCRSKAVNLEPDKVVNHMYDYEYHFTELNKKKIDQLLVDSINYQKNKKSKKEEK